MENRGGKRKGSGRKKQYTSKTVTVTFRVPKKALKEVKAVVAEVLSRHLREDPKE